MLNDFLVQRNKGKKKGHNALNYEAVNTQCTYIIFRTLVHKQWNVEILHIQVSSSIQSKDETVACWLIWYKVQWTLQINNRQQDDNLPHWTLHECTFPFKKKTQEDSLALVELTTNCVYNIPVVFTDYLKQWNITAIEGLSITMIPQKLEQCFDLLCLITVPHWVFENFSNIFHGHTVAKRIYVHSSISQNAYGRYTNKIHLQPCKFILQS